MKCISLWQPWATLLVSGHKRIETRSWPFPSYLQGQRIAIASTKKFSEEARELCMMRAFREALADSGHYPPFATLPLGYILGTLTLAECQPTEELVRDHLLHSHLNTAGEWEPGATYERHFGDFTPGRWGWICTHPHTLVVPLAVTGKQGFFDVEDIP